MNIASGLPKFVPLTIMQHDQNPYVRDDIMFIRVMLDFDEMPKTLLPYAFSLNPGLPTPMQQTMIQQEILKRQQQQASVSSVVDAETDQPLQQTDPLLNIPINTNDIPIDSTNNHMTH
jgi:hypothetical protein